MNTLWFRFTLPQCNTILLHALRTTQPCGACPVAPPRHAAIASHPLAKNEPVDACSLLFPQRFTVLPIACSPKTEPRETSILSSSRGELPSHFTPLGKPDPSAALLSSPRNALPSYRTPSEKLNLSNLARSSSRNACHPLARLPENWTHPTRFFPLLATHYRLLHASRKTGRIRRAPFVSSQRITILLHALRKSEPCGVFFPARFTFPVFCSTQAP